MEKGVRIPNLPAARRFAGSMSSISYSIQESLNVVVTADRPRTRRKLRGFSAQKLSKQVPDSMARELVSYSAHSVENIFDKLFINANDKYKMSHTV